MSPEQGKYHLKNTYGLFFLWLTVNSFLWIPLHTLVGYINLGIYGYQNSSSPVGFIAGLVGGLIFGLIQWVILSRNFSISPLWILSWVIGLTAFYLVNWYTGAILMGAFQQYLIKKKLSDSFLWFTAILISFAINRLLATTMGSLSFWSFCLTFFFYGAAYSLPTSILLFWYKYRLSFEDEFIPKPETM